MAALLQRGASVNVQTSNAFTALMFASLKGHPAVVQQLLAADADPSMRCTSGSTAAELAEAAGNHSVVLVLNAHVTPPVADRITADCAAQGTAAEARQTSHTSDVSLHVAGAAAMTLPSETASAAGCGDLKLAQELALLCESPPNHRNRTKRHAHGPGAEHRV